VNLPCVRNCLGSASGGDPRMEGPSLSVFDCSHTGLSVKDPKTLPRHRGLYPTPAACFKTHPFLYSSSSPSPPSSAAAVG